MKEIFAATVSAAVLLSACAQDPKEIHASYVSPVLYQNLSCDQLRQEAERVSAQAAEVTGTQKQKATNDAVAMSVGLIIFWPAIFMIKGDQQTAGELARLKGEMDAIQGASIAGNCGMQVQQQAERASNPTPATSAAPAIRRPVVETLDPASPIH